MVSLGTPKQRLCPSYGCTGVVTINKIYTMCFICPQSNCKFYGDRSGDVRFQNLAIYIGSISTTSYVHINVIQLRQAAMMRQEFLDCSMYSDRSAVRSPTMLDYLLLCFLPSCYDNLYLSTMFVRSAVVKYCLAYTAKVARLSYSLCSASSMT